MKLMQMSPIMTCMTMITRVRVVIYLSRSGRSFVKPESRRSLLLKCKGTVRLDRKYYKANILISQAYRSMLPKSAYI